MPVFFVLKGEIVAFENFGLIVKLTKHIKGICPLMHLSDITFTEIKRPAKKFVVGKKIKCRVSKQVAVFFLLLLLSCLTFVNSSPLKVFFNRVFLPKLIQLVQDILEKKKEM